MEGGGVGGGRAKIFENPLTDCGARAGWARGKPQTMIAQSMHASGTRCERMPLVSQLSGLIVGWAKTPCRASRARPSSMLTSRTDRLQSVMEGLLSLANQTPSIVTEVRKTWAG